MKIVITQILVLISLFVTGQGNKPITKPEMLVHHSNVIFEHFEDVKEFQFENDDSLNLKVTHSKKLDTNGNVIMEYSTRTQDAGSLTINEYDEKNQLIISTTYCNNEHFKKGEVYKSFFYYEDTLLIREESFEFKSRRYINIYDYGPRSGEDYQNRSRWEHQMTTLYWYNNVGKKTECKIEKVISEWKLDSIQAQSWTYYTYQYDANGRMINEQCTNESGVIFTIDYEYIDNRIISNLTKEDSYTGYFYIPYTSQTKTFDQNGNLVLESTIKGNREWKGVYDYNIDNELVRFILFDNTYKTSLTYIYKYKNKSR